MKHPARRTSVIALTALVATAGCSGSSDSNPVAPTTTVTVPFTITDLVAGNGSAAANGQRLTVDFTGWLYDAAAQDNKGAVFDSSVGAAPFSFVLGAGQVIAGWDQGLVGMRVGGRGASSSHQSSPTATRVRGAA